MDTSTSIYAILSTRLPKISFTLLTLGSDLKYNYRSIIMASRYNFRNDKRGTISSRSNISLFLRVYLVSLVTKKSWYYLTSESTVLASITPVFSSILFPLPEVTLAILILQHSVTYFRVRPSKIPALSSLPPHKSLPPSAIILAMSPTALPPFVPPPSTPFCKQVPSYIFTV